MRSVTSHGGRLLCLSSFFAGLVFYAPIATVYRQARGLNLTSLLVIESISLALGLLLEVPWGYVADRIGYRRTLVISSLVLFLSKIVFWKAHSFSVFLIERLLLAVANSAQSGVDSAYLSRVDGSQKGYGVYQASGMAGLLVVSVLFPFLSDPLEQSGWLTVITSFLSLGCMVLLPEVPMEEKNGHGVRWTRPRWEEVRFLLAVALVAAVNQILTVFLVQVRYQASGLAVSSFSFPYLALSLVSIAGGVWSERLYRHRGASLVCFSLAISGCVALAWGTGMASAVIGVLALRLGSTLFLPYATRTQVSFTGEGNRAAVLSLQQMGFDGVEILLSPLLGTVADRTISGAFWLGVLVLVIALGLLVRRPRPLRNRTSPWWPAGRTPR